MAKITRNMRLRGLTRRLPTQREVAKKIGVPESAYLTTEEQIISRVSAKTGIHLDLVRQAMGVIVNQMTDALLERRKINLFPWFILRLATRTGKYYGHFSIMKFFYLRSAKWTDTVEPNGNTQQRDYMRLVMRWRRAGMIGPKPKWPSKRAH